MQRRKFIRTAGIGTAAAIRAAREGANIVGVDWLGDLGAATVEGIVSSGGKAVFVEGDIAELQQALQAANAKHPLLRAAHRRWKALTGR